MGPKTPSPTLLLLGPNTSLIAALGASIAIWLSVLAHFATSSSNDVLVPTLAALRFPHLGLGTISNHLTYQAQTPVGISYFAFLHPSSALD